MLVPTFDQLAELRDKETLKVDILAGITVALILVPQSMAYAQLAGLPAYYGLYASFLPPMIAAIFGSSRQLATGPVAVVSLMTAASLEPLAASGSEGFLMYATLLAILIGLFQVSLGVLRLGVLVDFLSHPVVLGFTSAGAIIIGTSQISKLFGVTAERADHHYETVYNVIQAALTDTHWPTVFIALLSIGIMVGIRRWKPTWPAVLIAVVFTTLISKATDFAKRNGAIVGEIPEGLPGIAIPQLSFDIFLDLITAAIIISLIGFMEAISIAKAMAAKTRQHLDANQELFGQGLSNIASGLFSGYPVSGSFSRSAVNINAGARTGFSSIVTAAVVGITLLFLTPLLYHLPQATLATIIIIAVVGLVKIEPIKHAWKVEKHDGIVAVITFVLTLYMAPHLDKGILAGVFLSMALFIYRTMRPRFAMVSRHPDGTFRDLSVFPELETCKNIIIIRFYMSLYYANAGYFETKVLQVFAEHRDAKYIIIDAEGINMVDSTGEMVLTQLRERLEAAGVIVLIARMKRQFMQSMRKAGAITTTEDERFFSRLTFALEYAWDQMECDQCDNSKGCPLRISVARKQYDAREGTPALPTPVDKIRTLVTEE
ncbi:MAG: sulfate permease [Sedimenticola selenatireducens]|uniref:Sulfate permease n=2 Tax=Sedimenticola selenatireducens TaxID=191960 RepID=A0A558DMA3_9GAMM|nr:sulfate permease [Sedimenticola selenatireducens]TVT62134.1 MAG: sulfate permease [Sedimenticola selenatireducens]